jgi:two-component system NtrC family sensor kinase
MTAPSETSTDPRPEFAPALQTIVELVRRIMNADVASILSYSLIDETVRWKAASGFTVTVDYMQPVFRTLGSDIARRALENDTIGIVQGIGQRPEFPEKDFPVHGAEGICDMAVAPLRIVGSSSGALTAGYRQPHQFTEDEKTLLKSLAEIAAVVIDSERLVETVTKAESIWARTFEAIGEGILVCDQEQVTRCNAKAAEMMDMDPAAVIGLSFSDAFARMFGQRAADYYLSDNHGASTVVEIQTETGRRFLVSIFPILRPDGSSTSVVTWNDVTRLSEIQDQLGRSRRLASVGQLAAGVAHEVNNPLAAITTCAEAIMRDLNNPERLKVSGSTQWNYYLGEIVRQSLRCKEITRGLLDLTRQRPAKRVLCNLNLLAKDCARVALQRAGSSAEFEIKLDEGVGEIATDAEMVQQILDNLLNNAVDALNGQEGTVTVSTRRNGEQIIIDIADSGSGVPPEVLTKIFDPFFSTKGAGKGYGLGLAISLTLAESLGGGITVTSKAGEGTVFRLWLPRRAPEA